MSSYGAVMYVLSKVLGLAIILTPPKRTWLVVAAGLSFFFIMDMIYLLTL